MDAEEILRLDRAHVWHPYTTATSAVPVHLVRHASGVRLTLADGRELVDGMSSWWAAIHGYRHPRLDQAVRDQLDAMAHVMFGGLTHQPAVQLARTLTELTGLDRVFLADSGSVAVEVAIKMALRYAWTTRSGNPSRLLTVRGGYHGDTFGAMSVGDPVNGMHHLFAGMLPRQVFAPEPPAGTAMAPGGRPGRPQRTRTIWRNWPGWLTRTPPSWWRLSSSRLSRAPAACASPTRPTCAGCVSWPTSMACS